MTIIFKKGQIALGCATTNLAATNFENFSSMHGLFGLPVLTEDEVEDSVRLECRLDRKPQRKELIQAASLILIDEVCVSILYFIFLQRRTDLGLFAFYLHSFHSSTETALKLAAIILTNFKGK